MSSYKHSNDAYVDDGSDDVDLDLYEGQDDDEYIEGDFDAAAPKPTRKSTKGRLLKRWDADEDQLLLLYCDYVCAQEGTPMPWDKIAATMEPRDAANGKLPMTGEAVKQHLAKIRYHREENGRRVPPKLNRSARRVAAGTKAVNAAPHTPAPTPTKTARVAAAAAAAAAPGGGTAARGRAQAPPNNPSAAPTGGNNPRRKAQTSTVEIPVRSSTLLADVSKSKQKKEKQALKARQANPVTEYSPARTAGGVVSTGGEKRGRKKAALPEPVPEAVGNWSLRATVPHNYDETTMGSFDDIGIKDEEISDNEPLASKKAKTHHGQATPKTTIKGTTKTGIMRDTLNMWANQGTNNGSYESQVQPENVSVYGQAKKEPIGAPAYNQAPNNVQSQSQAPNFGARMQHPASSLSLETFQSPAPASFSSDFGQQFTSSPVHDASSPSFPDSGFSQFSGTLHPQIGSASTSVSSSYFPGAKDPFFVSSSQTHGGVGGLPITPINNNGVLPNPYASGTSFYPGHGSQYNGGNHVPPTPTTPTNYNAVVEWGDMMPQMQDAAQEAQNTFATKTYSGPTTTQATNPTMDASMHTTTNDLFATNDFFNDYVLVDEGDNDFS